LWLARGSGRKARHDSAKEHITNPGYLYERFRELKLTEQQQRELAEYLKSQ